MKDLSLSLKFMYYAGVLASAFPEAFPEAIDDMKHIQDLIDAEEQGLLLKLPCKVGDKIYVIENGYMYDFKIDNIDVRKENGEYIFCLAFMDFKADDFGKIVFLSEEEAEAKLKEMDGES